MYTLGVIRSVLEIVIIIVLLRFTEPIFDFIWDRLPVIIPRTNALPHPGNSPSRLNIHPDSQAPTTDSIQITGSIFGTVPYLGASYYPPPTQAPPPYGRTVSTNVHLPNPYLGSQGVTPATIPTIPQDHKTPEGIYTWEVETIRSYGRTWEALCHKKTGLAVEQLHWGGWQGNCWSKVRAAAEWERGLKGVEKGEDGKGDGRVSERALTKVGWNAQAERARMIVSFAVSCA